METIARNDGFVFIFTGTSGAGRKSIARQVGEQCGLTSMISETTRSPRFKDEAGLYYHFVSAEHFQQGIDHEDYLQHVKIGDTYYGIKKQPILEALVAGQSVNVVLNQTGAEQVKAYFGDRAIRIFIYTDKQTVRERMESQGASYELIEDYLDRYMHEVTYRKQCEHVIENLEMDRTVAEVKRIVQQYTA